MNGVVDHMMKVIRIVTLILCAACNACFLLFAWELTFGSVLSAILFFGVASAVQTVAHELGHLIGGKLSGYRFVFMQLGVFNLISDKAGGLRLSLEKGRGGQCVMVPKAIGAVQYKLYHFGGILANLLLVLPALSLLMLPSPCAKLFFINFLFASGLKIGSNWVPNRIGNLPNDGYTLKLLKGNPLVQGDHAVYLRLYAAWLWGEDVHKEDYAYLQELSRNEEESLYYHEIKELLNELSEELAE